MCFAFGEQWNSEFQMIKYWSAAHNVRINEHKIAAICRYSLKLHFIYRKRLVYYIHHLHSILISRRALFYFSLAAVHCLSGAASSLMIRVFLSMWKMRCGKFSHARSAQFLSLSIFLRFKRVLIDFCFTTHTNILWMDPFSRSCSQQKPPNEYMHWTWKWGRPSFVIVVISKEISGDYVHVTFMFLCSALSGCQRKYKRRQTFCIKFSFLIKGSFFGMNDFFMTVIRDCNEKGRPMFFAFGPRQLSASHEIVVF